jgi:hypothetical protein
MGGERVTWWSSPKWTVKYVVRMVGIAGGLDRHAVPAGGT